MKYILLLSLVFGLVACHTTKKSAKYSIYEHSDPRIKAAVDSLMVDLRKSGHLKP